MVLDEIPMSTTAMEHTCVRCRVPLRRSQYLLVLVRGGDIMRRLRAGVISVKWTEGVRRPARRGFVVKHEARQRDLGSGRLKRLALVCLWTRRPTKSLEKRRTR